MKIARSKRAPAWLRKYSQNCADKLIGLSQHSRGLQGFACVSDQGKRLSYQPAAAFVSAAPFSRQSTGCDSPVVCHSRLSICCEGLKPSPATRRIRCVQAQMCIFIIFATWGFLPSSLLSASKPGAYITQTPSPVVQFIMFDGCRSQSQLFWLWRGNYTAIQLEKPVWLFVVSAMLPFSRLLHFAAPYSWVMLLLAFLSRAINHCYPIQVAKANKQLSAAGFAYEC